MDLWAKKANEMVASEGRSTIVWGGIPIDGWPWPEVTHVILRQGTRPEHMGPEFLRRMGTPLSALPDRLKRAEHIVESAAKMMSPAALKLVLTYDQSEDECVERVVRFLSGK